MLLINYHANGFLADELFMSECFPPALRLSAKKPVAMLFGEAGKLKSRVDAERTKSVSGEEEFGGDTRIEGGAD